LYSATDLASVAVAAVLTGGLYATMSYGLALIYGVMKVVNLSHAGMMMLGAFAAFTLHRAFGLDPVVSSLLVGPAFFLVGAGLYRLLVRRVVQAPPTASLLLLFGVWLVAQNAAYLIWGNEDQSIVTRYTYLSWKLASLPVPVTRLAVFAVAVLVLAGLHLFLTRTFTGRAVRAVSQNRDAASLVGIDAERVSTLAFGLGTALAAFAGALVTLLFSFNPDFGGVFQLKSFSIIVLGGLENMAGVALGALVLAVVESYSVLVMRASLQNVIAFSLLVLTLVVLPGGLPSLFRGGAGRR
jgi:branched-chain amino acid transport system permease protein